MIRVLPMWMPQQFMGSKLVSAVRVVGYDPCHTRSDRDPSMRDRRWDVALSMPQGTSVAETTLPVPLRTKNPCCALIRTG